MRADIEHNPGGTVFEAGDQQRFVQKLKGFVVARVRQFLSQGYKYRHLFKDQIHFLLPDIGIGIVF
jgi:hypothetical protein